MLKQRLFTAIVLAALILLALFLLPSVAFAAFLGLFIAAASWEWAGLAGVQTAGSRTVYVVVMCAAGMVLSVAVVGRPAVVVVESVCALLWWLYIFVVLSRGQDSFFASRAAKLVSGFFVLIPAWTLPVYFQALGQGRPLVLIFLLLVVWLADSAAYFIGRAWGRTKLAPEISPGKSVEGLVGAVVVVAVFGAVFGLAAWDLAAGALSMLVLLAVVTALFSAMGDLVESKLKRVAGVKDSGHLFPGHGGVLDRIDAFTAAAPVFALGWLAFARFQ